MKITPVNQVTLYERRAERQGTQARVLGKVRSNSAGEVTILQTSDGAMEFHVPEVGRIFVIALGECVEVIDATFAQEVRMEAAAKRKHLKDCKATPVFFAKDAETVAGAEGPECAMVCKACGEVVAVSHAEFLAAEVSRVVLT